MNSARKIINDPVYGFITIDHPLLLKIISHPYYQRLRNIHQMAFAHLVYPGAKHTRLHHSLGAYHLMCIALQELKSKGVSITREEELGAKLAILLHDIGHGPFSHALEHEWIKDVHHEAISLLIMEKLDEEFDGQLSTAIDIFTDQYPKKFLHQLVSGQLDVDRMDYLNRDSFFTGVAEGVIGYDRIIKMLAVNKENLVVEEKAIYSIEKFLLSRRLMYWQVYLHKTVLASEMMLVMIMRRARELVDQKVEVVAATKALDFFLHQSEIVHMADHLETFCNLDDNDVMATLKNWCQHPDTVLSVLCRSLMERRIMKCQLRSVPISEAFYTDKINEIRQKFDLSDQELSYLVFRGETSNTTYSNEDEVIQILYKDGSLKNISEVDNALIHPQAAAAVKKYYICCLRV